MKPKLYGLNELQYSGEVWVPTNTVNIPKLIEILEQSQSEQPTAEWAANFTSITQIYNELFQQGSLSDETVSAVNYELLELAYEVIPEHEDVFDFTVCQSDGTDYYYEYLRSLEIEDSGSRLPPHLSGEADFI